MKELEKRPPHRHHQGLDLRTWPLELGRAVQTGTSSQRYEGTRLGKPSELHRGEILEDVEGALLELGT